eukprot:4454030-Pyramimonas_sp.AAC.1
MDPQVYQSLQATSPFASPRAAVLPTGWLPTWHPMPAAQHGYMQPMTETAQRAESTLSQQQWMHRHMRDAMEQTRRDGVDLPNESGTPAWEH